MTTTHNCAECGTRAEPGQSFCDGCGAVLSWTDRAGEAGSAGGRADGPADRADGASGADGSDADPGAAPSAAPPSAWGTSVSSSALAASASPHTRSTGTSGHVPTSTPAASGGSGNGGRGWDAFAGADGSAGLSRGQRDLMGAYTATAEADAPDPTPPTAAAPADSSVPGIPGASSHPAPAVDDTIPNDPVPAASPPIPARPTPAAPADPDGMTDRARRLLVPVADPDPRPAPEPSVAPVLPGRPAPQRPHVIRAPGEELGAGGGTPCPWCSTPNRPDRHFCTRCAMPMAGETRTPGRLPWWRRLFGAGNRETPWAGDRPRLRRTFDRVLSWLGVAVVLTLLIVLVINIPKGVQAAKDHFSKRASVQPDSWSASRSFPGHKPGLVGDKLNNTWWGPGVSESGQGQWLQAKFDVPTRLLDLIITPGVSIRPDQITQSARPNRLQATITLSDGKTVTRRITLDPGAGGQRIPFRVGTVSSVRFTIESATGTSPKKQVSIAEIEFFGPSSARSS
ncbi:NADase-type glycan-binding domain-containing protein [Streptomyces canus]|uniref:NADase-type glycan-binding domain-containing protein n=1 Tax=Streptomyces canus TaxID=58343 RepID=UPI002E25B892